jgi:hypothetical protein
MKNQMTKYPNSKKVRMTNDEWLFVAPAVCSVVPAGGGPRFLKFDLGHSFVIHHSSFVIS